MPQIVINTILNGLAIIGGRNNKTRCLKIDPSVSTEAIQRKIEINHNTVHLFERSKVVLQKAPGKPESANLLLSITVDH
jgi:hypothetical protein